MPMTGDQMDRITEHLRASGLSACPICGGSQWEIQQDVGYLGILDVEYRQPVEGGTLPVVQVSCEDCYYTFHLSAVRLGLFD